MSTTTAKVAALDMTELDWRAQLFQTLCDTGWASMMSADEVATHVDELVEHDLGAAERLPVGLIVGRRAWNDSRGTVDNLTYRGVGVADVRTRI